MGKVRWRRHDALVRSLRAFQGSAREYSREGDVRCEFSDGVLQAYRNVFDVELRKCFWIQSSREDLYQNCYLKLQNFHYQHTNELFQAGHWHHCLTLPHSPDFIMSFMHMRSDIFRSATLSSVQCFVEAQTSAENDFVNNLLILFSIRHPSFTKTDSRWCVVWSTRCTGWCKIVYWRVFQLDGISLSRMSN